MDVSYAGRVAVLILRVGYNVMWTHPKPTAALTRPHNTLR